MDVALMLYVEFFTCTFHYSYSLEMLHILTLKLVVVVIQVREQDSWGYYCYFYQLQHNPCSTFPISPSSSSLLLFSPAPPFSICLPFRLLFFLLCTFYFSRIFLLRSSYLLLYTSYYYYYLCCYSRILLTTMTMWKFFMQTFSSLCLLSFYISLPFLCEWLPGRPLCILCSGIIVGLGCLI